MKENVLLDKSFAFALKIISAYRYLKDSKQEYIMSRQMLRSGTSIGANARESNQAESRADFIHKLSISLKEAHECEYWMELLMKSEYLNSDQFEPLNMELSELIRLLTSIIKSSKKKVIH
jgi:four helix bundle protein